MIIVLWAFSSRQVGLVEGAFVSAVVWNCEKKLAALSRANLERNFGLS